MSTDPAVTKLEPLGPEALLGAVLALPSRREQRDLLRLHRASVGDALAGLLYAEHRSQVIDGQAPHMLRLGHLLAVVAELSGEPRHRARSLVARGNMLLFAAGKYGRAADCFGRAAGIYQDLGLPEDLARCRVGLGLALVHAGRDEAALAALEAAAAWFRAAERPEELSWALHHLAIVHGKQGRDEEALAAADEAIALERRRQAADAAPDPGLLMLLGDRALILRNLGRFEAAEADLREAMAGLEQGGHAVEAARCRQNLGVTLLQQGHLIEGLRLLQEAREVFLQSQRPRHVGRLDLYMAEYLLALNRHAEALARCRSAGEVFRRSSGAFDLGQASLLEGDARLGLGEAAEALAAYEQARARFQAADNGYWATLTAIRRARALLAGDWPDAALAEAEAGEAALAALGATWPQAEAALLAAECLWRLGRSGEAAGVLDGLEGQVQAGLLPALSYQWHRLQAQLSAEAGDAEAAMASCEGAMAAMEALMGHMMAEHRMGFMADKEAVFALAVGQAFAAGRMERALTFAERARARVLNDLIGGRVRLDLRSLEDRDRDLVASFNARVRERDLLLRQLTELDAESEGAAAYDPQPRRTAAGRLAAMEKEIAGTWERLLERDADYAVRQVRWTPPGAGIAERVDEDLALLVYHQDEGGAYAFVANASGVQGCRLELQPERIHTLLEQLALLLHRPQGDAVRTRCLGLLRKLHAICIEPVLPLLAGRERLVVVPHGVLHYLPFQALYDGDRYLVERHELSYLPSAGLVGRLAGKADPGGARAMLAMGHSRQGLLPETVAEAREVAALFGGEALVEAEATVDRLLAEAPHCRLLHVAAHGEFWPADPLFSGIELEGGWLKTVEVFSRLRLSASLVTLSACHTGRSRVAAGDEILGLTRAFLAAGARSLLMSLWAAHDRSTRWLMRRFYGYLLDGRGKGAALRAAQLDFLAAERSDSGTPGPGHGPLDWAPFILVGDAGRL